MKRVAFIINSTISKRDKYIEEISSHFNKKQFEIKFFLSEYSRHIESLCKTALDEAFEYLILVGGDGTLNEGVNGLLKFYAEENTLEISSYNLEKLKQTKIGLLPKGSGNDFARTIGIDKSILVLKNRILADKYTAIDIGFSKFLDENKKDTSRFYINIADVGMGGVIAKKIIDKNNAFNADFVYMKAIVTTLLGYKNTKAKYTSDFETWESNIMSVIFANGKFFASGLGVSPNSELSDGTFEIIKLGNITILDYILNLINLKRSRFIKHKEVTYSKAKNLSIEPTDGLDLAIDMDGEFVGYAPMHIECVPKAINFIF